MSGWRTCPPSCLPKSASVCRPSRRVHRNRTSPRIGGVAAAGAITAGRLIADPIWNDRLSGEPMPRITRTRVRGESLLYAGKGIIMPAAISKALRSSWLPDEERIVPGGGVSDGKRDQHLRPERVVGPFRPAKAFGRRIERRVRVARGYESGSSRMGNSCNPGASSCTVRRVGGRQRLGGTGPTPPRRAARKVAPGFPSINVVSEAAAWKN